MVAAIGEHACRHGAALVELPATEIAVKLAAALVELGAKELVVQLPAALAELGACVLDAQDQWPSAEESHMLEVGKLHLASGLV